MHTRPIKKFALALTTVCALSFGTFLGCSGDTDGGSAAEDAGVGTQFVSDGGAGATISIDVFGKLRTAETVDFIVTLLDPEGAPIPFVRIFCESEGGIAILEPSRGGVAFESTASNGIMSGVLGGVTPGSYLLECRAEQGFNLKARASLVIEGDVPPGFNGFPGAAGGNLGGGLLVEEPEVGDLQIVDITFQDLGESSNFIDIVRNPDCDADPTTNDPEPYFFNTYIITIANGLPEAVSVTSVTYSAQGATVTQSLGTNIPAGGTGTAVGNFTDVTGTTKFFADSGVVVPAGTYDVSFTVTLTNIVTGERFTLRDAQVLTTGNVDNCDG